MRAPWTVESVMNGRVVTRLPVTLFFSVFRTCIELLQQFSASSYGAGRKRLAVTCRRFDNPGTSGSFALGLGRTGFVWMADPGPNSG